MRPVLGLHWTSFGGIAFLDFRFPARFARVAFGEHRYGLRLAALLLLAAS
jgi:hypothetical protein